MSNQNDPSIALQMVHRRMQQKFLTPQLEREIQNAKDLEVFLSDLKQYSLNLGNNSINQEIKNEFYDQILKQTGLHNYSKMFTKTGGINFERVFARIEAALGTIISGEKQSYNQFMTGKNLGEAVKLEIEQDMIGLAQKLGMKIHQEINANGLQSFYVVTKGQKQIKTDNKGFVNIGIQGEVNPKVLKLYSLLNQATFSLKNYSSISSEYNQAFKYLQLGHTKIDRILIETLATLFNNKVASQVLRKIILNSEAPEVMLHVQHIRQIYELTGLGQIGQTPVKYIIYNDPGSPYISVRSTAEIIKDILTNTSIKLDPFGDYNTQLSRDLGSIIATYDKEPL